jgi:hypothetical protein
MRIEAFHQLKVYYLKLYASLSTSGLFVSVEEYRACRSIPFHMHTNLDTRKKVSMVCNRLYCTYQQN